MIRSFAVWNNTNALLPRSLDLDVEGAGCNYGSHDLVHGLCFSGDFA